MKDYYDVLDIPVTATPEQIKAQYRQLVRIYHPDRFMDKTDKVYAEEKLKEINIAFQVLSGAFVRGESPEMASTPRPVAYPPALDFGTLPMGVKGVRSVQIGNTGGDAKGVNFVYSLDHPWFKISKGKRVYADQPFPLDFQIMVDTRQLKAQQKYQELLTVELDGVPVRIPLTLTVAAKPQRRWVIPVWVWSAVITLVILALVALAPILGFSPLALDFSRPALVARPAYELHHAEMLFSVRENELSTLYAGLDDGSAPRRLGVAGKQAVGTQHGQQIAYLSGPAGSEQIYLFSLTTGTTTQLTRSEEPKAALAWSPDGTRLGYLSGAAPATRLGVYDFQAEQEFYLPGEVTAGVGSFAWAPDGQSLLFDLAQNGEQHVYRINVVGDRLQQLTSFNSRAGAWSPDGRQVALAADKGLHLLNSDGQQLRQLNSVPVDSVRWSTTGEWLAYATPETTQGHTLWLVDPNGAQAQQVAANTHWYLWSPDGATLGYVTGTAQRDDSLFYLWTVTPGGTPTLVAEVSEPFFAWPQ